MKRIAIVGAGISGLTAAWVLGRKHEVVLFEAENYIGGHTRTIEVKRDEADYQVDIGFIVFNDRTYPNFNRLLSQLGIAGQPTAMGFSVSSRTTGVEYSGGGFNGLFAQRRNLFSPRHWRMLREIVRFNRDATRLLENPDDDPTMGEYLDREGYSAHFRSHYILSMGGAIWSCGEKQMEDFPARFFIRFFANHGLLSLTNRPQWYVVPGGSTRYVEKMLARMPAEVRAGCPVRSVRRSESGVEVISAGHGSERFDDVIFACHSDQALALLADAEPQEKLLLGDIPYQLNDVVLHTDTALLPANRRTWSSWNALLGGGSERPQLTYNMNILQGIEAPVTFCVTLNANDRIAEDKVIGRYQLAHPVFTPDGQRATARILARNGHRHTWFCGAWCRYGFHEDGVLSALNVCDAFGESL